MPVVNIQIGMFATGICCLTIIIGRKFETTNEKEI